jgi:hypothetical protein
MTTTKKREPETVDRFRISIEVPKEQLGHWVTEFTKMGLQHISHELVTDVLTYKEKKPRTIYETSGDDLLREWIKSHATFKRKEVLDYFEHSGRTAKSGDAALARLIKLKEVKPLGQGNYQRAGVKAIAAPKKAKAKNGKKTTKPPRRPPTNYKVPNIDLILGFMRKRKKVTLTDIQTIFVKNGRPAKSVSPILTDLIAKHKVRRVGAAEYSAVIHHHKSAGAKARAKLNGAAPETHQQKEVMANG